MTYLRHPGDTLRDDHVGAWSWDLADENYEDLKYEYVLRAWYKYYRARIKALEALEEGSRKHPNIKQKVDEGTVQIRK